MFTASETGLFLLLVRSGKPELLRNPFHGSSKRALQRQRGTVKKVRLLICTSTLLYLKLN